MSGGRRRFDIRQASRWVTIGLGAWLVIAIAFHVLVARPRMVEYRNLVEGSAETLQALQEREARVVEREQFLAALQKAEADMAMLRSDVLSTRRERLVEVQREVEALCRQFGIDLDSVNYDSEIMPDEGLDRLVMVVPLEGGYANLRRFLQAVENSSTFLLVERVALGEGKEGGSAMLQLNITLATYFDLPGGAPPRQKAGRPRARA